MIPLHEFAPNLAGVVAGVVADAALKAAVILFITALTAGALRRSSAALRHRVWSLGLCGVLLMPLLSLCVPQVRLPILPPRDQNAPIGNEIALIPSGDASEPVRASASDAAQDSFAPAAGTGSIQSALFFVNGQPPMGDQVAMESVPPDGVSAKTGPVAAASEGIKDYRLYVACVWLTGVLIVLAPLVIGFGGSRRLLRNARRLEDAPWVALIADLSARIGLTRLVAAFESLQPVVPMTWGVVRPTVIVPASWRDWPAERRRCVLLHELAHVKRLDVFFQIIGRLAVAFNWMNPLAWYALRQLRVERELACDDCVIACGERASVYARELVQIARLYRPRPLAVGVAMAKSGRLDDRVVGILDQARSRLPVSRKLAAGLLAVTTILVVGVAGTSFVERSTAVAAGEKSDGDFKTALSEVARSSGDAETMVTATGLVVDENGNPVASAAVHAMRFTGRQSSERNRVRALAETSTAIDGAFSLTFPDSPPLDQRGVHQDRRRQDGVQFVATANGHAIGFVTSEWRPHHESVRIQLGKPEALNGRLIDLEGQPLAGVQLHLHSISLTDDSLDDWLRNAVNIPRPDYQRIMSMAMSAKGGRPRPVRFPATTHVTLSGTPVFSPVITDGEGRFSIPGVGPNRLVELDVVAPQLARTTVKIITRRGPAVHDTFLDPRVRDSMIHGEDATIAIEPGVILRGVVTEAGSGRPVGGCKVQVTQVAGSIMAIEDFAATETDSTGHYVMNRLPPQPPDSDGYRIRFAPPAGSPYFVTDFQVRVEGGGETVFDVDLPRARTVKGRVVDGKTGEPVRAMVGFLPTLDNKIAADYPNFNGNMRTVSLSDFRLNEPDGTFSVPAINGRGVLCVTAERLAAYAMAGNADQIEGLQTEGGAFGLYHLFGPFMCNEFRELNLHEGQSDPVVNVELRPLSRRKVLIVDRDGEPVSGCQATGLLPDVPMAGRGVDLLHHPPLRSAETEVIGLEFESPRGLAFHHPGRNIGGVHFARHEEQRHDEPLTVTLEACGRIRGQLLDQSGDPVIGQSVRAQGLPDVALPKTKHHFQPASFLVISELVHTDAAGRFEIARGVIPGIRYQVIALDAGPPKERRADQPSVDQMPSKDTIRIEPGATVDIGELRMARQPTANSFSNDTLRGPAVDGPNAAEAVVEAITIEGSVNDSNGKPISGARVQIYSEPFGLKTSRQPRLVATSDASGAFRFSLEPPPPHAIETYRVLFSADGSGPEWMSLSDVIDRRTIRISLPPDHAVRGRVLTLEGQPVSDANVRVLSIRAMHDGDLTRYIEMVKSGHGSNFAFDRHLFEPPHLSAQKTDEDGRFQITGIGRNRVVELQIVARSIQHSVLRVMALESEPVWPREGRGFADLDKALGRSTVFGASFEWLARPSRPIRGIVVDSKTGEPLGGIQVGSLDEAVTFTDNHGRFELLGCVKADHYSLLASAEDQPYLLASKRVADAPGLDPLEVKIEMTRGVVVEGQVRDDATGKPITARVSYYPLHPNEHVVPGVGGSEARAMGAYCERRTDHNGRFSIAVLPGPGFIGAIATDRNKYQAASVDAAKFFRELSVPYAQDTRGMVNSLVVANGGGARSVMPQSNFHAIELLNLPADSNETNHRDVRLRPAYRLAGTILDPQGRPLDGATAFGLTAGRVNSSTMLRSSEFTVTGLGQGERRGLLFRHDARRLVGTVEVTAETPQPLQVTLQEWGEVSGRMIDQDGQPLANLEIGTYGSVREGETAGFLPVARATDDRGQFHIDGLVPGRTYPIRPRDREEPFVRVVVRPGEKLSVGDVSGTYESANEPSATGEGQGSPLK